MLVVFIDNGKNKNRSAVRTILDSYAMRVSPDTWSTNITSEGLETVYRILRKNMTKNTFVLCYVVRKRRLQLLWSIGEKYGVYDSVYPVGSTGKKPVSLSVKSDVFELMKIVTALSGLFHDLGKYTLAFQKKLKKASKEADLYRHEVISYKVLETIVAMSGGQDDDWIDFLLNKKIVKSSFMSAYKGRLKNIDDFLSLPPLAEFIGIVILSHHKLAYTDNNDNEMIELRTLKDYWDFFCLKDGYYNEGSDQVYDDYEKIKEFFPFDIAPYKKRLRRWLGRAKVVLADIEALKQEENYGKLRRVLFFSRLALIQGDYYVSAEGEDTTYPESKVIANLNVDKKAKQSVIEHLCRVCDSSLDYLYRMHYTNVFDRGAVNTALLEKQSPPMYSWQDKAVSRIKSKNSNNDSAFFVVNMASTSTGKTMANAKIMKALAGDAPLRYNCCLGLRSLTLQVGESYMKDIGLSKSDYCVLVGTDIAGRVHEQDDSKNISSDISLDYVEDLSVAELQELKRFVFSNDTYKMKALLSKPVVVSTLDYFMDSVETVKGGRYIIPVLRLMHSDLVIDEIDLFDYKGLVSISRLIYLAGFFGRNVVISSATVIPDIAKSLYRSYSKGVADYNNSATYQKKCVSLICDEFRSVVYDDQAAGFDGVYDSFCINRVRSLGSSIVKRKAKIIDNYSFDREEYYESIVSSIIELHRHFKIKDIPSGKNVSFGAVRFGNIKNVVDFALFLEGASLASQGIELRFIVYHSRFPMIIRHSIEKYLDSVLVRKYEYSNTHVFEDSVVRGVIDNTMSPDVVFVVICSPAEEIGRDHDFDWGITEPTSIMSLIQFSGRVLRHRILKDDIGYSNIYIMNHNLNQFDGNDVVYSRPGYEQISNEYRLRVHDFKTLTKDIRLTRRIDSKPRLVKNMILKPNDSLIDLEHFTMEQALMNCSPRYIYPAGYTSGYWYLTGMPTRYTLRGNNCTQNVYLYSDGVKRFFTDREGNSVNKVMSVSITSFVSNKKWLDINFDTEVKKYIGEENNFDEACRRFGEMAIPYHNEISEYCYNDFLGLYKPIA